jgi:hypothetical protein
MHPYSQAEQEVASSTEAVALALAHPTRSRGSWAGGPWSLETQAATAAHCSDPDLRAGRARAWQLLAEDVRPQPPRAKCPFCYIVSLT